MTRPERQQGHSEPTTIGGYTLAMGRALDLYGVGSAAVFRKAGVDSALRNDPMIRLPYTTITRLFKLCVEATGDPCFGLQMAKQLQPSNFHVLGYSLMASGTLREFCQQAVRYFRIASQAAYIHISEDEREFRLATHLLVDVCYETQDAWTGFLARAMRQIYRFDFYPLRVELIRPEPPGGIKHFGDFFKAPVSFGHEEIALYLPKDEMDVPLTSASPELAKVNEKIALQYLARLDRSDMVAQVKSKVVELLPMGEASKERVAQQLNLSQRSLHLKLAERNTTFQELLDQIRQELAQSYIVQPHLSISEISYLLGFADTASFTRAFRRWKGCSPSSHRKQLES